MATRFSGPVFIVGMPRSGTKLVRALLNQHPQINLTLAESHFIPYFVRKFGNPPPFRRKEDLNPFVRELKQTSFYSTMSKAGYKIEESAFLRDVDCSKWSSVFEHVFRHFGSKSGQAGPVWGDKTPGYINHLPLLKYLFPNAKFLHVVRDPRDYCLSVRKSFKKSIYRAAVRWQQGVGRAHRYGARLGEDYREVRYELLLEQPVATMTEVSAFIGVPYDDRTVNLASAPEDLGDAKGHSKIVTDNKGKYLRELSSTEVARIEEIVCDVAESVGYRLDTIVAHKSVNPLSLTVFKLRDGIASLRHHVASEGEIAGGARHFFHHYIRSSWRGI
jgi:hypothetical protein